MKTQLLKGDNLELLPTLADNSIDAIVTDPPYELGFMGKSWDSSGIAYKVALWAECLRVLKPGGHLIAFGGSRTYHRIACAVEDAGFEIRDQLMWVYGSGFPKSLDVSKAIDKQAGAEVKVGKAFKVAGEYGNRHLRDPETQGASRDEMRHSALTDDAKTWQGWGTALKPSHEPMVLARKPLGEKTVAENVLRWGTGALNIDGCRVGGEQLQINLYINRDPFGESQVGNDYSSKTVMGRWPANFIHDGSDEVLELFPDSKGVVRKPTGNKILDSENGWNQNSMVDTTVRGFADSGSVARFFYCAKASKAERNAGLDHLKAIRHDDGRQDGLPGGDNLRNRTNTPSKNFHPTVKPIALMRYLIRLVTPPNGTVLDPFAGSGTTLVAAIQEKVNSIGIELTEDYWPIIEGRTQHALWTRCD